ncbi:MAG: hypothetical protein GX163_09445 [Bacteroidetes bacterium]|nr:hypothetical protein [Bacteroidota bacterium]
MAKIDSRGTLKEENAQGRGPKKFLVGIISVKFKGERMRYHICFDTPLKKINDRAMAFIKSQGDVEITKKMKELNKSGADIEAYELYTYDLESFEEVKIVDYAIKVKDEVE